MTTIQALRARAMGKRTGTSAVAIQELIRQKQFILSASDFLDLEQRNDLLAGWVFVYRFYQCTPETRPALLRDGLLSTNPRIREQVCDLVGDLGLWGMKEAIKALFSDPVPYVAQAARYNHKMLEDAPDD